MRAIGEARVLQLPLDYQKNIRCPTVACGSNDGASFFIKTLDRLFNIVVMRENPFGGNGPGRLDYYLWPYLKKDLELGLITLEEAKEIIDELFLRFEERLYNMDMWVEAIVVGGTNPDGSSSFNPLTHIMIESFLDLKIIHPAIYIRVPIKYDEEILKICSRFILEGNNRAQILNDKSIITIASCVFGTIFITSDFAST